MNGQNIMSIEDQGADTTNSDETLELDLNLNDTEDVEAIKAKAEKAEQFARQAITRAKKAEEALKNANGTQIINNKPSEIEDERLELRLDGYSKDDVTFIMNNGGRKVLDDKTSYVTIALNAKREQKRAEEAASKTEDASILSEVERKYTPEQMQNMTAAELAKLLPHTNS